jgi:hypothetical protein
MTTNLSFIIIPALAIVYLVFVYSALLFAKRSERTSRPEG